MEDIRKEQIQDELFRIKKTQVKNSRGLVFTPTIGDLVLFQPKGNHNMSRFGRVTKVFKHGLTFVTRKGESITKPIRLTSFTSKSVKDKKLP